MMVSKIHGIMSLSTSHKGTSYAHTLSGFPSIVVGSCSKIYVTVLENASTSIQDITEQFHGMVPRGATIFTRPCP
jgi:hypothetical protein